MIRSLFHSLTLDNDIQIQGPKGKKLPPGAEKFPHKTLDTVTLYGISYFSGCGYPYADTGQVILRKKHEKIPGMNLFSCF